MTSFRALLRLIDWRTPPDTLTVRQRSGSTRHIGTSAGGVGVPPGTSPDVEEKLEWMAMWDADWEQVTATGEHLDYVMWSDDRAVGMRGWYY